MTPADMKAAEAVCNSAWAGSKCMCAKSRHTTRCKVMSDAAAAVLSAYGLDRDKANGLASGRLRIKRATRKEQP